jgi:TetR/AcrR family transcriptional regulator of autoinduction and epiphytic fitness
VSNRGRPSKKNHIITSAGELFCELGYQGTSIDLVVQRAEVSKPTVYNNFPSKLLLYKAWQASELARLKLALKEWIIGQDLNQVEPKEGCVSSFWSQVYEWLFADLSFIAITRIIYGEPYKLDTETAKSYRGFLEDIQVQGNELLACEQKHACSIAKTAFLNVLSDQFLKLNH